MSKSIFISHAVADVTLAAELVELLEGGIGIPEAEIFCSSLVGHGIPVGENFVDYIKSEMTAPEVVVLVLTPNYFASKFCLCELGAAWVKSHKIFPILVPPLKYDDVKGVLSSVQVINVDDDIRYNEIRDYLTKTLEIAGNSNTKWDVKRKAFMAKLPTVIANLTEPKIVTEAELSTLQAQLNEALAEYSSAENEISQLKSYITKVEKLKNAEEVKYVQIEETGGDINEELLALTKNVTRALSSISSPQVRRWAICDHYNAPYRVEHEFYGEQYEDAARRKQVRIGEDGDGINWSNRAMASIQNALNAVDHYVSENHSELSLFSEANPSIPIEADNQDFWEYWDYI